MRPDVETNAPSVSAVTTQVCERAVAVQAVREVAETLDNVAMWLATGGAASPSLDLPVTGTVRSSLDKLSTREREVTELVVRGATDREIARDLGISTNTVNGYLMAIKRKLGVANRVSIATVYYGDTPYYLPAAEEAPGESGAVETAPLYAGSLRGCARLG